MTEASALLGKYVTVSMREAFFDSIEPGVRYVMSIAVRNISMKGQRVRFVPPRSQAFMLAVQNDIELAPGLELVAELSLQSDDAVDIHDQLSICVGRTEHPSEELMIPIRALQPAANLFFEPLLDFGTIVHGHAEMRHLTVVNRGTRDGKILVSPQIAGSKFNILPVEAIVQALRICCRGLLA